MPKAAVLRPSNNAFARRLRWVMSNGPRGPMQQIEVVKRVEQLGLDGPTRAEVNRLVQDKSDPKLSTLRNLAAALDVTVGDLMPVEDGRVARRGNEVRVPRANWTRQGFDLTGDSVVLPGEVVPSREQLVAVVCPTQNMAPRIFAGDLLVIDPNQRVPYEGALMAVPHPASGALVLLRSFQEADGLVRFADYAGYVFGDESLPMGEVVATCGRVLRRPGLIPTLPPDAVATLRESLAPAAV